MFKENDLSLEMNEPDVSMALETLNSASFRNRFVKTDFNAPDPEWNEDGLPVEAYVNRLIQKFRNEAGEMKFLNHYSGVLQKYDSKTLVTIANHITPLRKPTPRDLLHVYGPDRDNLKDREMYYAYAWKDPGPHSIFCTDDNQIIREGKLCCSSYAYSGQSSYALAGAGLLFSPGFGPARISIRPLVQWSTYASFTGTTGPLATTVAHIGIFVESWKPGTPGKLEEKDLWVTVWNQTTSQYIVGNTADGTTSVSDGLSAEVTAIPTRKYAIFVYIWLETTAGPEQQRNDPRFVRLDMEASVPYVVIEEKLL